MVTRDGVFVRLTYNVVEDSRWHKIHKAARFENVKKSGETEGGRIFYVFLGQFLSISCLNKTFGESSNFGLKHLKNSLVVHFWKHQKLRAKGRARVDF